jgi:hypothetical protein
MRTDFEFTPRQLMAAMIALAALVLLVPIGVQAATNSVSIADPVKATSKARVVQGKLEVGDGAGPLTVDGMVGAQPAAPAIPLWGEAHLSDTNRHATLVGPFSAKTTMEVTSLVFANSGTTSLEVRVRVMQPTTSRCDSGSTPIQDVETVEVPPGQTLSTPFPTPIHETGPCITALLPSAGTGSDMWVTLVGYR